MERRSCIASTAASSAGSGLSEKRGHEAGGAQHAQRVVAEGDLGIERRAQPTRGQVGQAVEGVDQLHVGQAQRQRVDGEVAPRQVLLDVVAEGDLGLARVGHVDLGPVRGDLEELAAAPAADRAEARPLGPHVVGPAPHQPLDLVGTGVGGEIEVGVAAAPAGKSASRTEPPTRYRLRSALRNRSASSAVALRRGRNRSGTDVDGTRPR